MKNKYIICIVLLISSLAYYVHSSPLETHNLANTSVDDSKLYGIRSVHDSDLALEIFNSERTAGINAQGGKYFATHNQLWYIREYEAGSSYVYLENANSGLVAHLLHTEAEPRVISETYTGADNQLWLISINEAGQYSFENKATGQALALENPDSQFAPRAIDEAFTNATNQLWHLEAFDHVPVYLGNYHIFGAQELLATAPNEVSPDHGWNFRPAGDGYYLIESRRYTRGPIFTVVQSTSSDLYSVTIHRLEYSDDQLWKIIPNEDGTITLQSKSGFYFGFGEGIYTHGEATLEMHPDINYNWIIKQTRHFFAGYTLYNPASGEQMHMHENLHVLTRSQFASDWVFSNYNGRNYTIHTLSEHALDIHGALLDAGVPLQVFARNGLPSQEWSIVPLTLDTFKIISVFSGLAATISDENSPHFIIKQEPFQNLDSQIWKVMPDYRVGRP